MIQWHDPLTICRAAIHIGDIVLWQGERQLIVSYDCYAIAEDGSGHWLLDTDSFIKIGQLTETARDMFLQAVVAASLEAVRKCRQQMLQQAFAGNTATPEETRSRIVDLRELESQGL